SPARRCGCSPGSTPTCRSASTRTGGRGRWGDRMVLAAVRDELGDRLATINGLRVHRWPPDNISPPAAIVSYPDSYEFDATFSRGTDRVEIPVVVVVGKVSERAARARLSGYIAGSGPRSVEHALERASAPPAPIVSSPDSYGFDATCGRGTGRVEMPVVVVVGNVSGRAARAPLSGYVAGSGPRSVKHVLDRAGRPARPYTAFASPRVSR